MHSHIHRSPELSFDPGDFIHDPSKVIARVFDQIVGGPVAETWADEIEADKG